MQMLEMRKVCVFWILEWVIKVGKLNMTSFSLDSMKHTKYEDVYFNTHRLEA